MAETTYYEFEGQPAIRRGDVFRYVLPDGSEKRIESLTKFLHEAIPLTEEQFNKLAGKDGGRELAFAHHPDSLAEPGAQEKMIDGVADGILDMVDEERSRQGLAPLRPGPAGADLGPVGDIPDR